MNKIYDFFINNTLLLILYPLSLILLQFKFCINKCESLILIMILNIISMFYYGIGRGFTEALTFIWKDKINNNTNVHIYHTFTLIEAYGFIIQFFNFLFIGIIKDINILFLIYYLFSSFIIYYFFYARMFNYMRKRQWYLQNSYYKFNFNNKQILIPYISKNISLYLFILVIISMLLVIIF